MSKATRIMVIDGSAVTREVLVRTLREELPLSEITTCKNGAEALTRLAENSFDLITTALLLPDMDGLALSRNIRQMPQPYRDIPIIVVSGDADSRLLEEGFEAGVTDYYDKSNGYKSFASFIKSFILRHSTLSGRILFVEDSQTAAAVTIKLLKKNGLQVTHTTSAEYALELIPPKMSSELPFDMVITDFYLDDKMTGGDLLHAIRTRLRYSQQELPVLVITGNDDNQAEVFHAGANDFVNKPIIKEVLLARVRSLLLIKHQFEALKQQAEAMRWITATDSLTGVRSRRYLIEQGENYLSNSEISSVSAVLLEVDDFEQLRQTLGTNGSDRILIELGTQLSQTFPNDLVVRYTDWQFCILAHSSPENHILEKTTDLMCNMTTINTTGVKLSFNLGLASRSQHPAASLDELLAMSEQAIDISRKNKPNQLCVYDVHGPRCITPSLLNTAQ